MPLPPLETSDDIEAAVAGETEAVEEIDAEMCRKRVQRRTEGEGDGTSAESE